MTSLPLVSIVTSSFNQAYFLQATFESLLGQDYTRLETLDVEGGSTTGDIHDARHGESRLTD